MFIFKKLTLLASLFMVGMLLLAACGVEESTPTPVSPTAAAIEASADGIWTKRADMPTERWEPNTCVVDGKIYVIGGAGGPVDKALGNVEVYDSVNKALGTVEVYDPVKDTWTTKSEMPTARQGLSTNVVDGKIYAVGGAECISSSCSQVETFSTVEEYDPATDTWTTKSPIPTERGWHSASVVDGKIYIIGGSQGYGPGQNYHHVLTVEVYDPATDTWSQKGDMPKSRAAGSASVVDGKIYLIGGHPGGQKVDEFDPATDTWKEKSEMPTSKIGLSTSVLDGKIYAIGGYNLYDNRYPGETTVYVYDPAMDTWTTAPDMPTGRFGAYTSVVDGKIYVFGGLPDWPASAYGIVEVYDP